VFIVKEFKTMSERDREDLANFLKRIADELSCTETEFHKMYTTEKELELIWPDGGPDYLRLSRRLRRLRKEVERMYTWLPDTKEKKLPRRIIRTEKNRTKKK
jgi:hypothetical protein